RPSICASRQRVQDLRGTGCLLSGGLRRADIQPAPAWRITGPECVEGTGNRDLRDARCPGGRVVHAVRSIDVGLLDERDRDGVRTGLHRQTDLRLALQVYRLTVDRDVDVLRSRGDDCTDATGSAGSDLQVVVGVQRECVANDHAPAGPEWQAVEMILLRQVAGGAIRDAIEPEA